MMQLKQIQSNLNMIEFRGLEFYFSYETLVMVFQYKTGILWVNGHYLDYSRTTTRHINKIKDKYQYFEIVELDKDQWQRQITYGMFLDV